MNDNLKEVIKIFKNKYKAKKGDIVLISTDEDLFLCKLRDDEKINMEKGVSGSKELLMIKKIALPLNIIIDYAANIMNKTGYKLPETESLQPKRSIIIANDGQEYSCFKLTISQFNAFNAALDDISAHLKQGLDVKEVINASRKLKIKN